MCGIAGIINLSYRETPQAIPVRKMAEQMIHRGPDDEGYAFFLSDGRWLSFYGDDTPDIEHHLLQTVPGYPRKHIKIAQGTNSIAALCHRRLSIVDLSYKGHQPMTTPDMRYWIVFNGEVYNFPEIAKELRQKGIPLFSHSDTEVILQSYALWGPACLDRFNGMFAFAIWDNLDKILFCARDRIGIKPFYYTVINGQFIFASDIKTLIASGLYKPEPDMEGLYLAMAFGIAPRPKTAFNNITALEQAHWMTVDTRGGKIRKNRYWSIPIGTQNHSMSEGEAVELLEERLTSAIKYRLVADVPVGTFMSGGLDSTTISAMASRQHPGIKAFTLAYENNAPEFDEVEQARATAALHPMTHIVQTVKPEDTLNHLEAWVDGYEEPFYHLAANYVISKIVKDNSVTVVLNGLGGDELFAGYSWYSWAPMFTWLQKIAVFHPLSNALLKCFDNHKLTRFFPLTNISSPDRLHTALFIKNSDMLLQQLFNVPKLQGFNTVDYIHDLYAKHHPCLRDPVEAMSYMDIMNYIGNHHVHRIDQFTMAHSIEGRFPFLDHVLVEAAYIIPTRFKLCGKIQKYALRRLAEKYIAPQCLSMKKKGFGLPLKQWMQGPLSEMIKVKLQQLEQHDFLNGNHIRNYRQHYENGRYPATYTWHLVMLELWFERFIKGEKSLRWHHA